MIEYYRVPAEDAVLVMPGDLRRTVTQIFEGLGFPENDAKLAADVLVVADIRGVETHGVSNMLRYYVDAVRREIINPKPNWKIVREKASTVNIECDRGLGLVICPKAMEIAIERASQTGLCTVTLGNGRHAGMIAYYPMMALPHDMIGYCITSGGKVMVPTFGAEPRLAPNPHAWAVPADKEPPFVLDISCTGVAANKLALLKRLKKPIPAGLLSESDGRPIMESRSLPDEWHMLPLGSTPELGSHKGYGFAAIAQILSGVLADGTFGDSRGRMSHLVAAYSVEAFTDVERFKTDMDRFLRYLRETPPAPGHDRVYYPGLMEHEETEMRMTNGIPLHREVVTWFDSATEEMHLEPLVRKSSNVTA